MSPTPPSLTADAFAFCEAYRPAILLLTGFVLLVLGAIFLWLARQAIRQERWTIVFAFAFMALGARSLVRYLESSTIASGGRIPWAALSTHLPALASTVNNVMFLAVARLLGGARPFSFRVIVAGGTIFALTYLLTLVQGRIGLVSALPDAAFTLYCYGALARAGYLNINIGYRRRPTAFWGSIVVAAASMLHGALLASSALRGTFVSWDYHALTARLSPQLNGANHTIEAVRGDAFDGMIAAAGLPLKLVIFVAGLTLLKRTLLILLPTSAATILDEIARKDLQYLSSRGIVRAICESAFADLVELSVVLAGSGVPRILRLRWHPARQGSESRSWPDGATELRRVLETGEEVREPGPFNGDAEGRMGVEGVDGMRSAVMVPIKHHGAVIGSLAVLWGRERGFRPSTVRRIRLMADLVAPVAEESRKLDAIAECGRRFARVSSPDITGDPGRVVRALTEIIHDVLTPRATRVDLDVGFRAVWTRCDDSGCASGSGRDLDTRPLENVSAPANVVGGEATVPINLYDVGVPAGTMTLTLPSSAEKRVRPVLGVDSVTGPIIASLVADTFRIAARAALLVVQNDLQNALHKGYGEKGATSVSQWFEAVEEAAERAGLMWVVVELADGSWLGDEQEIAIVRSAAAAAGMASAPRTLPMEDGCLLPFRLKDTRALLWLAVARTNFGGELDFDSPWSAFLRELSAIADSALYRITMAIEMEKIQFEAVQNLSLATAAAMTNMLLHEIRNQTTGISDSTKVLQIAQQMGVIDVAASYVELINAMGGAAERLSQLTRSITELKAMDSKRPCCAKDIVDLAVRYFDALPARSRADVMVEVDAEAMVDVPFHVLFFSVVNLLRNAFDAIRVEGRVEIRTTDAGALIELRIADNGSGVSESVRTKLFSVGGTTKQNGSGLGLPLTQRSLQSYGAEALLEATGETGSTFLLRLPKAGRRT